MEIAVSLAFAIFVFILIILFQQPYGTEKKEIRNRLDAVSKLTRQDLIIDDELNKPLYERFIRPIIDSMIERLRKLIPQKNEQLEAGRQSDNLKKKLRQAGTRLEPGEYRAIQILAMGTFALLVFIVTLAVTFKFTSALLAAVFGLYFVYVVMRFNLAGRITRRHEMMSRQLPDVLDMLSVSVEAGLGLEQAIFQVINHFKGPLIDELSISYREMSLGRTRRDALQQLGERSGVEDVKSFCRAIIQAGEMGISVKTVLRAQAHMMRQTRRNKVEEKAMQVAVKILIPMAFLIFPVIFIVLLGPAALTMMEALL